ncbi:RNA polymerase sigma factor [Rhodopirellula sp. P2]|uniref:RNA polymerase sigma factor n=1 Tax=Rhodopirellula sp. P2 TaxID=2127060 RepID=UPI002367F258|nr:sigma-70 family RNA polymerase sigma factor [Rhodopirellula sp. P2]WDQ16280.1 sigma-70 family RNA polymerase sigma factor [Rhodopirellula sp. P2]
MNNAELIDGLRNRDPSAAQYLNDCFVPSIWRFVFYRVDRDAHLAEDIVAEAVLALMSAAIADTEIENPAGWLRTVAHRRIQDHYRAAARVRHLIEDAQYQGEPTDENDPATQHDQEQQRESVREAVGVLPEHYQQVLEWKYVDQISVKVIAARLDTTEKSVQGTLFRARQALRDQLKTEPIPPSPTQCSKPCDESPRPSNPQDPPSLKSTSPSKQVSAWFFT